MPEPAVLAQLLVYGLTNGAVIALSAAGFTLAYAVARQINLAHGNVFALTTVALSYGALWLGLTAAVPAGARVAAVLGLAVAGALVGALLNAGVERLAFAPFAAAGDRLGPLVAAVGLSYVMFQAAVWWYGLFHRPTGGVVGHIGVELPLLAMPELVPNVELGGALGVSFTLEDALVLALAGAVAIGTGALLSRTRAGRALRATAEDPELAALSGADPRRVRLLAFAVAGGLVGFAAAISAVYYGGTAAHHGLRGGLTAMTAAILGGAGSPRGALAAGMLLGVLSAYADFFLDAKWTPVLVLTLLVGLLALRPEGLLGRARVGAVEAVAAPAPSGRLPGWALWALLGVGLLVPLLAPARLPTATQALLLVSLAVGLGIVVVFAGLLDLGYAAFFALGGYTLALLTARVEGFEPWLALGLAGAVAAGFGLIFGLPSVRTRGEYLAIVTIALGEIVPAVIWHMEWTGGARGVRGARLPETGGALADAAGWVGGAASAVGLGGTAAVGSAGGGWAAPGGLGAYVLALALAAGVVFAAGRLLEGRVGRAWAAVRDDEAAAAALGVAPAAAKLRAFVCGAAVAGLAGALFAGQSGYVEPAQFDLTLSLMVLAAVVAGSAWGVGGIVLGALAVAGYDRVLVDVLGQMIGVDLRAHNLAAFGAALYATALARARLGRSG